VNEPSYDDVATLPISLQQRVPVAFEDINGHLNIRHYVGIASEGLDETLETLGIPQLWPLNDGQACFTAEHHMRYLAELRTGEELSVRVRFVGRSERAAHVLVFLLDETHQRVSYVMEEIFLHVSMETRRTSPWPDDIAQAFDAVVEEHRGLGWEAPLSGSMALR